MGRGRPELYDKTMLEDILHSASSQGKTIKQYCADNSHVYISVIVALKRHGLSPRAGRVANPSYTAMDAMNRVDDQEAV